MCNPIFDRCSEFITTLLAAFSADPDTKAIFVCPARLNQPWFKELCEIPFFKVVAYYTKGSDVFTAAKKDDPFAVERKSLQGSYEPITIWELSTCHANYPAVTLD